MKKKRSTELFVHYVCIYFYREKTKTTCQCFWLQSRIKATMFSLSLSKNIQIHCWNTCQFIVADACWETGQGVIVAYQHTIIELCQFSFYHCLSHFWYFMYFDVMILFILGLWRDGNFNCVKFFLWETFFLSATRQTKTSIPSAV